MKNKALLFLATLASLSAYSASVTINVATEGTLEQVLSEQSVTNVTELTITGRLTAADLTYLRTGERVASVETLDLSGVTLVSSDEPYNTLSSSGALGSTTYYFYIGADSTKLNILMTRRGASIRCRSRRCKRQRTCWGVWHRKVWCHRFYSTSRMFRWRVESLWWQPSNKVRTSLIVTAKASCG